MAELSVLILCGRSPRHLFIANRLCRAARVMGIVQEVGHHWTLEKALKLLRPGHLRSKARHWLRNRLRTVGGGEARFFFGRAQPRLDRPDLITCVPHINHPRVIALADQLQPDVIAVFGTSLIREPLLSRGRLGIINLHGGLSPEYRGVDCTFWALYNGEPEKIGCTLHFVDHGIDTGRLIAHVCPEIHEGDNELLLFWRSVRDSADVYAEALERLAGGEVLGVPQESKGQLYQVKDRGLRHEWYLRGRLRAGLLHGLRLPRRVTWFSAAAQTPRGHAASGEQSSR